MSHTPNASRGGDSQEAKADWVLVERVAGGDDDAFAKLVERFKGPVHGFVFRMLGNAAEAEDVAADVFVRAYRTIRQRAIRQASGAFSTWLFRVARNATLDRLRYRKRHPAESLSMLEDEGAAVPGRGLTPDEEVMTGETGRVVAEAVALLPEEQRVAVILAEYDNCSYAEIADVLHCTQKSVETRLYRARRFLRQRLAHLLPN